MVSLTFSYIVLLRSTSYPETHLYHLCLGTTGCDLYIAPVLLKKQHNQVTPTVNKKQRSTVSDRTSLSEVTQP